MNWKDLINKECKKEYYQNLLLFLKQDREKFTIYPNDLDIMRALHYTPLDTVKVVILGQDPYHGLTQAHGLAFSVLPECSAIPPSLKNVFTEINSDLGVNHKFTNGYLVPWAQQGVLLLNSVLTVRAGQPRSHRDKGWEIFTDEVIKEVNNIDTPVVFILWGADAKAKKKLLTNNKHLILESVHPSPLAAFAGFFGCKHFSKANSFLEENGLSPINWIF